MVADKQLLDMARGYFHFFIRFFEVIKISAPHIYHSALEPSPTSSMIWEHYHCQPFWGSRPRVVYGLHISCDRPAAICQGRPRWLVLGRMSVRSGHQLSCQGSRSMGMLLPLTEVTLYRPESSSRVEGRGRGNTRRDRVEKSGSQGSKYQRLD